MLISSPTRWIYMWLHQSTRSAHCQTLQHVAIHFNTLQHNAAHFNTLHHTAIHCCTLQCTPFDRGRTYLVRYSCVALCCSMLQYVAVCCSILQCEVEHIWYDSIVLQCVAVCRSMLQYVAMWGRTYLVRCGMASVSRIDKIIGLFCKRAI